MTGTYDYVDCADLPHISVVAIYKYQVNGPGVDASRAVESVHKSSDSDSDSSIVKTPTPHKTPSDSHSDSTSLTPTTQPWMQVINSHDNLWPHRGTSWCRTEVLIQNQYETQPPELLCPTRNDRKPEN
jgi:hypothetical protein